MWYSWLLNIVRITVSCSFLFLFIYITDFFDPHFSPLAVPFYCHHPSNLFSALSLSPSLQEPQEGWWSYKASLRSRPQPQSHISDSSLQKFLAYGYHWFSITPLFILLRFLLRTHHVQPFYCVWTELNGGAYVCVRGAVAVKNQISELVRTISISLDLSIQICTYIY